MLKSLPISAFILTVAVWGCSGERKLDESISFSLAVLESKNSDWKDLTKAATSLAAADSDEVWMALKRATLDPYVISRLEGPAKKRVRSAPTEGVGFEELHAELLAFMRGVASGHPERAAQLLVFLASSRVYQASQDYADRTRVVYASFRHIRGCPATLITFSRSKLASPKTEARYRTELMRALASSGTEEALGVFGKHMISREHYHILLMHRDTPEALKVLLARLSRATKSEFLRTMVALLLAEERKGLQHGAMTQTKLPPIRPKGRTADVLLAAFAEFLWGQERQLPLTAAERRGIGKLMHRIRQTNLGHKNFRDVLSEYSYQLSVAGHEFSMQKQHWEQGAQEKKHLAGLGTPGKDAAFRVPDLPAARGFSFRVDPVWGTLAKKGTAVSQVELNNIGLFLDKIRSPEQCRAAILLLHADFDKTMVSAHSYSLLVKGLTSYSFKHLPIKIHVKTDMEERLSVKRDEDKKIWMVRAAFVEEASIVEYTYVVDSQNRFGRIRRFLMEGPKDPINLSWSNMPEAVQKRREAERLFRMCRSFLTAYPSKLKSSIEEREKTEAP